MGARAFVGGALIMGTSAVFIADSLDNARKFKQVLSEMDVSVFAGSSAQARKLLQSNPLCDLVIVEARGDVGAQTSMIEDALSEEGSAGMLVILDQEDLSRFRLPLQTRADFVMSDATEEECATRIRQLLWPGNEASRGDFISVDAMTINLATYQVKVSGVPLDLTYLEYALLAFLVTHPGRTYSRDTLLRRVWGFDYYGGSRTVDVHVRRIRAKLGPELAQHLETVRGVGYLWS